MLLVLMQMPLLLLALALMLVALALMLLAQSSMLLKLFTMRLHTATQGCSRAYLLSLRPPRRPRQNSTGTRPRHQHQNVSTNK